MCIRDRISVAADTVARFDNSRMIARAVTDLPEPDSPTKAMVWPFFSVKDTTFTLTLIHI